MRTSEQRRETFEKFRREKATVTPIRGTKEVTVCTHTDKTEAKPHPGGRRWGYPVEFKMDFIRAVREQGMSIGAATRKFDISLTTANKWLDYYDLKRIPPKGSNEYPINPQAKEAPEPVTESQTSAEASPPAPVATPPGERRENIRDAIGLIKQAIDLLFLATRPKQPAQEPARHV